MLTFYGTGMILGAGIYSIIGKAAGKSGEGLWLSFLLAAVASLLTALSYAELSTMFPKAGAEYVYLRHTFTKRRWIAAATGIMMAFAGCATAATVALAFAGYLQHFIQVSTFWVAFSLLVFFSAINIVGIKESGWVNAIFTLIEISGLILFIWLGWHNPKFGEALSETPNFSTISGAALIIFAYFGFENIVNLAEETIEPEKTVPRAIIVSLLVSTILYILVSLAAVALMPPSDLAQTDAALTDAAKGSSPGIASILGGIALFSTANTALIALVTTSRILYGIATDGSLPKAFARTLKKRKTPWVAGLISLIVAVILLPLGEVEIVASVSSLATMIAFIAVNAALIVLRIHQPNKRRPFKVPLTVGKLPILPCLGIAVSLVFLFQFDKIVYFAGIIAFLSAGGIYFLHARGIKSLH